MIKREAEIELRNLARQFKAVALVGPRQSGKTTLVRYTFPEKTYVNLENLDTRAFAKEDPRGFLAQFPDGAILDEAQRVPELFSYLQQILDETKTTGKFIISGSNNFLLQENISQSLSGRIAYLFLMPFTITELQLSTDENINTYLLKGAYQPVFDQQLPFQNWYSNYIRTYIERDVRQIKNIVNLNLFEKFLRLCAGRTGQLLNINNLATETGVDNKTINAWLSVLESSFIIHQLRPHYKNFNKRIVKMAKLYFYDTGVVCSLLGIQDTEQLALHPLKGGIFENLAVSECIKHRFNSAKASNLYFWRNNTGHEIDIIIENPDNLYPVEIKSGQTITKEFFKGLDYWHKINPKANGGAIIYAGTEFQKRSNNYYIVPWQQMHKVIRDS